MLQCPQRCHSARPTQRPRGTAPRARMVGLSCRPRPRDASSCAQATKDDGAAVRWKRGGLRSWQCMNSLRSFITTYMSSGLKAFAQVSKRFAVLSSNQKPNKSVTNAQTDTLKVYGPVPLPKAGNPGFRSYTSHAGSCTLHYGQGPFFPEAR